MSSLSSSSLDLPLREIPGNYGFPFVGAIKDRWDFFHLQGRDRFFRSRMEKHNSTVFRANMPPGPWISSDPRVIVVLDANTFPILFDTSKVEKLDIFVGTYMPSTSFNGGYRVCSYLDPSEPKHGTLKSLLFSVFASNNQKEIIPLIQNCLASLFSRLEDQLGDVGRAQFGAPIDDFSLDFFFSLFCDGKSPLDTKLESKGPSMIKKWVIFQLSPIQTLGLPKIFNPLEDFVLHSIGLPFFLLKNDYKKLYDVFSSSATSFLDKSETLGLSREEACHNLIFFVGFNSSFAISRWFPSLLKRVASQGESLHHELADEIRTIVKSEGGITHRAINRMALTKSAILEALRIEPPIPYQYGRAKDDMVIESHDARFKIKRGELVFGYQAFATKDPKIFDDPEKFVANRFVGKEGEKLLKYVLWSNGKEIDDPTIDNKQCPGKDIVELLSSVLLAELFLRYDTFSVDEDSLIYLKKASST